MKNKFLIIVAIFSCFALLTACNNSQESITQVSTSTVNTTESGEIKELESSGDAVESVTQKEDIQYTEVRVSSAKDIFQNVKPYTRIILTDDFYNISKIDPTSFKSENAYLEDAFDGYEFVIHDIDHFEICADKNVMPEIVTEAPHVNVISLKNCKNVKIDGIIAGHAVEKGYCSGGVVYIDNSSDIEIDNCHLYGCGTYGIISDNSQNINVNNSEIYECTYGLIDLNDSSNFNFNNCTFKDSEEFTMFAMYGCKNINFENCTITGNKCSEYGYLVSASESSSVVFTKCLFENNTYDYFCTLNDDITLNSCKGKDENFENKAYPDYSELDYEE